MGEIYVEVLPKATVAGDLAPQVPTFELLEGRIGEIGDSLGWVAVKLRDQLEERLPVEPKPRWALEEVEVMFSVDLESEAGVIVARASAKAGFEATLKWKKGAGEGQSR